MVAPKVIRFTDWKVQRCRDGKPLTIETARGATMAEAVERLCGKGLVTVGREGTHVARARAPRSGVWVYYYRATD